MNVTFVHPSLSEFAALLVNAQLIIHERGTIENAEHGGMG